MLQIQADLCVIHSVHASSCELYHLGSIPNSASDSQHELPQKYSFVPLPSLLQGSLDLLRAAEVTHREKVLQKSRRDHCFVRN